MEVKHFETVPRNLSKSTLNLLIRFDCSVTWATWHCLWSIYEIIHSSHSWHCLLEVLRTNLHLGSLDRVVGILPVVPCHSLRIHLTIEIQTIQVWMMAAVVPPSSFIGSGTIARVGVIVAIFSGKWKATMITKGIACSTWGEKTTDSANIRELKSCRTQADFLP